VKIFERKGEDLERSKKDSRRCPILGERASCRSQQVVHISLENRRTFGYIGNHFWSFGIDAI
jgi:hypothetical protein